jgi:hypothetical protein
MQDFFVRHNDYLRMISFKNVQLVSHIKISREKVESDVSPPSWFKSMEIIQAMLNLMRIEFNNLKQEKKDSTTTYDKYLFGKLE